MRRPFPELEPDEEEGLEPEHGPGPEPWRVAAGRVLLLARGPAGPRRWSDWAREAVMGLVLLVACGAGIVLTGYLDHVLGLCTAGQTCPPGARLLRILVVPVGFMVSVGFLYLAFVCLPVLVVRAGVWRLRRGLRGA